VPGGGAGFPGDTADPVAFTHTVEALPTTFGRAQVMLVGDWGVVMVAHRWPRIGRTHTGPIVTIAVEYTCYRVSCDGTESVSMHAPGDCPIRLWKAKVHAPRL
jgi:hypothetical protein